MPESLPSRNKLSPERAREIIGFIQHNEEVEFGSIASLSSLRSLAIEAYDTLNIKLPTDFETLLERKIDRLSMREKRLGKALTPERAQIFFDHLLGKIDNPHFRDEDTILTRRMLLRKAIAIVAREEEAKTGENHHHLLSEAGELVDSKYPLAA